MFSRLFVNQLIAKDVKLISTPVIEGNVMTITEQSDIDNPQTIELIMRNNIETLNLEGSKLTSTPMITNYPVLKTLNINARNIQNIADYSFENCINLKTVILHSSVTKINDGAFAGTGVSRINLGKVQIIGNEAFLNCFNLKSVDISSVTSLGTYCFSGTGIESISINNQIQIITMSSFERCLNLTTVKLGDNVNTIDYYAFLGCIMLSNFDIGNAKLTTIENEAFKFTAITRFTIDSTVKTLGDSAFHGSKLESLTFADRTDAISISTSLCQNCYYLKTVKIANLVNTPATSTNCFKNCVSLESISLPSGFQTLGEGYFANCTKLTSVQAENLHELHEYAFYNCSSLSSFPFGHVTHIGELCFAFCKSLTTLSGLPTGTDIAFGQCSFQYCTSLDISNIPYNWNLEDYCFLGCSAINKITIAANALHEGVFAGCSSLMSVEFSSASTMKEIGPYCFMNCTKLSAITIGSQVKRIGYYAFAGCPLSGTLNLNQVTSVSKRAFEQAKIEKLVINNDINFDVYVFNGCTSLTTIEFGKYVTTFSLEPFVGCENLVNFICESNTNMKVADGILVNKYETELIAYPPGSSREEYTIPIKINKINQFAFAHTKNTNKIVLDHYIVDSRFAFSMSSALKTFVFEVKSEKVDTYIRVWSSFGENAFEGCRNLKTVTFVSPVYSLGSRCFKDCCCLENIDLSSSCSIIGDYCFSGCTSLEQINIEHVDDIPIYAFNECKKLKSVKFSSTLKKIGESAFAATGIESISLPDTCLSVGSYAFHKCMDLKSAKFGNLITKISSKVFYNTSILNFVIPKNVREIETDAFQFSNNLTITVDPENMLYAVDGQALIFKPLNKLLLTFGKLPQFYTVPNSVQVIGKLSINPDIVVDPELLYPYSLGTTTVVIPETVITVEDRAFDNCKFLYNLCYKGKVFQTSSVAAPKIFVTENYPYILAFKKEVIRGECSDELPENYKEYKAFSIELTTLEIGLTVVVVISLVANALLIGFIIFKHRKDCKKMCEKPDAYHKADEDEEMDV